MGCSVVFKFQDILFTKHDSLEHQGRACYYHNAEPMLYMSDPCEHLLDAGFFRGIFKSFATAKVRKLLISKRAPFHSKEVCPYCKAKLWNMLQAEMIPSSASFRLGAYEDSIECYVCLNGHMLGTCTFLPFTDTDEPSEE